VTQRCVRNAAVDKGGDRERRVHQHDGRTHGSAEMVVDVGGVVAGDGHGGKQPFKEMRARVGELVQG
jgi:hypothetical protein